MEPYFTADSFYVLGYHDQKPYVEHIEISDVARSITADGIETFLIFNNAGTDLYVTMYQIYRDEHFVIPAKTYYVWIGDTTGTYPDQSMNLYIFFEWSGTTPLTRTLRITKLESSIYIKNLNVKAYE